MPLVNTAGVLLEQLVLPLLEMSPEKLHINMQYKDKEPKTHNNGHFTSYSMQISLIKGFILRREEFCL